MKIEDNHYTYRIETKDSNGGSLDFIDIDTVEPLRCAYDIQDELNLETNEHIKRVEEIVLDANSTEFWYVDEARTSDTHLVCYFEEVKLMASKDHPMVDTNRSVFEYGKINSNEHQNTNFICTHVMDNGVSRIYMSIDKETFGFATFDNETIKYYISNNPITVWYALRYEVIIPRSLSKGHLLTLSGQTDVTLTTTSEQAKLPIMKFNIGDTQYTLDTNPIHINNTQEGTQIRNIVLEGNTPINYARGNGVNTTEQVSNTRYDFEPFYDGQATIQGTVEGGYVSAKLYGDTMVNIAKPYGETPLLTATNESVLCDDLLGMNEEGIVLADGEITEGRIYGDSVKIKNPTFKMGNLLESTGVIEPNNVGNMHTDMMEVPSRTFSFYTGRIHTKIAYYDENRGFIRCQTSNIYDVAVEANIPSNAKYVRYGTLSTGDVTENNFTWKYENGADVYGEIKSVVNPTVELTNADSSLSVQATFPYTLNKLPNGVADYIDVVNKVHVQRVGRVVLDDSGRMEATIHVINGYVTRSMLLDNSVGGKIYANVGDCTSLICDKLKTINYEGFANKPYEFISVGNPGVAGYNSGIYLRLLGTSEDEFNSRFVELAPITLLYELATPIYTPLTEEEIAQLPLSAYKDGYVNLSSDQLTPSFEFRMKASNRYQVDMLETGYYYLNAPVGNVKLGTANVDVQQMPCIVKVDNVGSGDSGYRLGFDGDIMYKDIACTFGGYVIPTNGNIDTNSAKNDSYTDFIEAKPNSTVSATTYIENPINNGYGIIIGEYDSSKEFIKATFTDEKINIITITDNTYYIRVSYRCGSSDSIKKIKIGLPPFITLAKLPSHRIPTTFTQGMKCATDFGYWEGIKESAWKGIRLTGETGDGSLRSKDNGIRYLNRIEGFYQQNVIVEDEFDFGTGKLTKRVGKIVLDGSIFLYDFKAMGKEHTYMTISGDRMGVKFKNSFSNGSYGLAMSNIVPFTVNYAGEFNHMFTGGNNLMIIMKTNELGTPTKEGILKYFEANPMTVYYELAVPEISYVDVLSHEGKTANNETKFNTNYYIANTYLQPQFKPSHLTYPVPSLVGNRTYTVVHNRKNISGSTKSIELNLGGTVVQLNDASSKTLVKTPSTLAHNNLIFIGGESTVDHIMVLDGDWTNKPIEYFENMKGHDTDAIITIIGDGKIDDVAEQYLW